MTPPDVVRVASSVLGLAWRAVAAPVLGLALVLGVLSGRGTDPAVGAADTSQGPQAVADGDEAGSTDGGRAVLRVDRGEVRVVTGDVMTTCLVRDARGRELAAVHLFRDGTFGFHLANDIPVQANGKLNRTGSLGLSVGAGDLRYLHEVHPDGTSALTMLVPGNRVLARYRITPDGAVTRDEAPGVRP
jgi:hypothetical protein